MAREARQATVSFKTEVDTKQLDRANELIDKLVARQPKLRELFGAVSNGSEGSSKRVNDLGSQVAKLDSQMDKAASSTRRNTDNMKTSMQQYATSVKTSYGSAERSQSDFVRAASSGMKTYQNNIKDSTGRAKQELESLHNAMNKASGGKVGGSGMFSGLSSGAEKATQKVKSAVSSMVISFRSSGDKVKGSFSGVKSAIGSLGTKLKETGNKARSSFNEMREKLGSVQEKADKTSHVFGKMFGASLIANGVTNMLGKITGAIDTLKESTVEYDNKQRTMTSTWNTLTGSNGKGKQMVDIGNGLASAFNQNIDVVDELNQSFYHVFDNAPRTKELTKSILTLGDTLNLSDQNVTRLGTNFTHMLSSGKMQLGDFNMINDQLPMYAEKMLEFERKQQNNSKLSMSELRKQMSAGKISADDAEKVMNSLGDKYAKASENLMKTIPGMERSIKTQMPALLDAVYKPIADMKSPLFGQFTKWIGSSDTKEEFKTVGSAIALQMKDISAAFGGKKFDLSGTLNKGLADLAKWIDKTGATIIANKKNIKDFFAMMKTGGSVSFKVMIQTLKDLEPVLAIVGKFAEKHPKMFVAMASSALVASKAIGVLSLAMGGLAKIGDVGRGLKGLIFKPKIDTKTGKHELTLFAKAIKGTAKGIGKVLKWTAKVGWKIAKGSVSLLWKATKGTGKLIGKSLKWTAKIAWKGAKGAVSLLWKATKGTGRLIGKGLKWTAKIAWKGAKNSAGFLWKNIKKTSRWIGKGLTWTAKIAWKGASKAMSLLWKAVKGSSRLITKALNAVWKGAQLVAKGFKLILNVMKANPWTIWIVAIVAIGTALYQLYKHNKKFRNFVNGIWKSVKEYSKIIYGKIKDLIDWFVKYFRGMGKDIGKLMSSMWHMFKDSLKLVSDIWHGNWGAIGRDFKNIWKDIKGYASDGMNVIIDIINGGITAIDKVLNLFGAKGNVIKKMGHVHFATGGEVRGFTHAVVNDGHDAPENDNRELITLPGGRMIYPRGQNVHLMLPNGSYVHKASETSRMMGKRFANGGLVGDAWNAVKSGASTVAGWGKDAYNAVAGGVKKVSSLVSWATKIVSHPLKSLEGIVDFSTKGLGGQIVKELGSGMIKFTKNQIKDWWSALWSQISDDAMGDAGGAGGGLLGEMIKDGGGKRYVYGAAGPTTFDCSGLVQYAANKLGMSLPRTSGAQFSALRHTSSPSVGDLVFFGPGGSQHVGVYAGPNRMYSAQNEHTGIGYSSIHGFGESLAGYGKVPNSLKGTLSGGSKKSSKGGHGLLANTWGALGGVFKWVEKFLAPVLGGGADGGSYNPALIAKAARMMHIDSLPAGYSKNLQAVINNESGGKSVIQTIHDGNSGGNEAGGILQYTPGTFNNYAMPGHKNRMNPLDELLAFFNNSDWRNAIGWTTIWGHRKMEWLHAGPQGSRRLEHFANGGVANRASIFGEVKGEPEYAINPKRGSADVLLQSAQRDRNAFVGKSSNSTVAPTVNINVTVNGGGSNANDIANKTSQAIAKEIDAYFQKKYSKADKPVI